jgi:hypothetical protein
MSYYPQPGDGISKPLIDSLPEESKSNDASQPQPQAAETTIKDRMSSFEKGTLRWTRAMFVVTAATGIFIGFQWHEMHDAGTQTDKIIAADQRIAKAMEDTVSNAIEISRNDQRAWVGISGIQLPQTSPKKAFVIQIPYSNSGRSLALDVRTRSFATSSDGEISPEAFIAAHKDEPFKEPVVVFPGIPSSNLSIAIPADQAASIIPALRSGAKRLYVLGEIRYKDVFNRPHHTTFCGEYSPKIPNNLVSCKEYNTAD